MLISVNQWLTSRSRGLSFGPQPSSFRQKRDLNSDDDFADDDEVVWYHSNTLYTVYALTDGSGNVVERYRYDAYGACTVLDADFSADSDGISDVSNAHAFTARRLDAESGLMQYRHRYYAPLLGRFVSRDPLLYKDSPNFYLYVSNSPTGATDPFGESVWCLIGCHAACHLIMGGPGWGTIPCVVACHIICDTEDVESSEPRWFVLAVVAVVEVGDRISVTRGACDWRIGPR